MTSALDTCAWRRQPISVPVTVGELTLLSFSGQGIRCEPDIFVTPPLSDLTPPMAALRGAGAHLGFAYSYPLTADVGRFAVAAGGFTLMDIAYSHYYVETRGDFQAYLAQRNKKTVATIKRKVKKVETFNGNGITFTAYATPAELEEFLRLAAPVSEASYQHRLLGQGLPTTAEYRAEVMDRARRGEIYAYLLWVGGEPAAYTTCPVYGGSKALYHYTGYDPRFSDHSPGTVLQYKIVEDLFRRENVDYYDLCTGEGMHKELFATGAMRCGNLYFCALFSRYTPLLLLRPLTAGLTELAKTLLDRLGLKAAVKKFIRRAA